MTPAPPLADQSAKLAATYASPSHAKSFTHSIPAILPSPNSQIFTEQKTRFLLGLRTSLKALQGEVNVYLTERMEEDKLAAISKGTDAKDPTKVNSKGQDEVEEERYGEDAVDDDEE